MYPIDDNTMIKYVQNYSKMFSSYLSITMLVSPVCNLTFGNWMEWIVTLSFKLLLSNGGSVFYKSHTLLLYARDHYTHVIIIRMSVDQIPHVSDDSHC